VNQFERIQLVILSYNRLDCMPRLFDELLLPAARKGVQVTVVDNASERPLREFLSNYFDRQNIEIVLNDQNCGVAKGRNAGFKRSTREFIIYLDDDSLMQLDALERVPTIFDELPEAGILAFHVVHGVTGEAQNEHGNKRTKVGNFHGAGHAIRCSALAKAGYLDEACFFGAEEIEFTMRMLVYGLKTIYLPEIVVRHFSFPRAGKDNLGRRIYWTRNYAMVLFRYLPTVTATLFSFRLLVSYFVGTFKEIKLGAVLLFPAMIKGAITGLRSRQPLDAASVAFYAHPATRPDLGNVSISSKIRHKLFSAA
jgi:GT2 family glycosyltransferase